MKMFSAGTLWITGFLLAYPVYANIDTCRILCDANWLAEVEVAELRDILEGEAQSEINGRDDFDWTPLHLAARWSRAEVIEALIHAGARLDAVTEFTGQTPMHSAVASGQVQNMGSLILAGASIESRCLKGGTPLHWAAQHGSVQIMGKLIDAGAMLEARDQRGYTPLHWAAKKGTPDKLHLLIEAGANMKARTGAGQMPGDLAVANHRVHGTLVYWKLHDARFD
jgi:cytohesin